MKLARMIILMFIFSILFTSCKKQTQINFDEKKVINEFQLDKTTTQTPLIIKKETELGTKKKQDIEKNDFEDHDIEYYDYEYYDYEYYDMEEYDIEKKDIEIIKNRKSYKLYMDSVSLKYNIQYSNDGQLIALFNNIGHIMVFKTKDMKMLTSYYRPGNVVEVDFSSNNKYIIAGYNYLYEKCFFVVWDLNTNEQLLTKTYNSMQTSVSFQKIQFLEDSDFLFIWMNYSGCCGFSEDALYLYDLVSGKQFRDLTGSISELSNGVIFDYFFTDNAHQIYILSYNGWCVCWDIVKMQKVKSFRVNKNYIQRTFNYSNDYKLLAVFDKKNVSITNIDSTITQYLSFFPPDLINLWIINESEILYQTDYGIYKADIRTKIITKLLNAGNYDFFTFNPKINSFAGIQNSTFQISSFSNPDKQLNFYLKSENDLIDELKINANNQLFIKSADLFYKTDISNIELQQKKKMISVNESEFFQCNLDDDINSFISKLNLTTITNRLTYECHVEYRLDDKKIIVPLEYSLNMDPEIKITNDKKYIIIKSKFTQTTLTYYYYYICDIYNSENFSRVQTYFTKNEASVYYFPNLQYFVFFSCTSMKIVKAHDLKVIKEMKNNGLFFISNDNQLIAYITQDGTIEIIDTKYFNVIIEIQNIDNTGITSISFSDNNKLLFLCDNNTKIKAINISSSEIYADISYLSDGSILVNSVHNDYHKVLTDTSKLRIESVKKNLVTIESQLKLENKFSQVKDNLKIFGLDEAYLTIPKIELPVYSKELFLVIGSEKPDMCEYYSPFNNKYISIFSINPGQSGHYYYFRFMEQGGKEIWGKKIEGLYWPEILLDDNEISIAGISGGGWPTLIQLSNDCEIQLQLRYYANFVNSKINSFCKLADNSYLMGIGRGWGGSELLTKINNKGVIEWHCKFKYKEWPVKFMQLLDCKDYGFYCFGKGYYEVKKNRTNNFYFFSKIDNNKKTEFSISPIIQGNKGYVNNIKMFYLKNGNIFITCNVQNSYVILIFNKMGNLIESYKIKSDLKNGSLIKIIELDKGNFIFGYGQYDKSNDTANIHFFISTLDGKILHKFQFGSILKESLKNFYIDDEYNMFIAGDTTTFTDIDTIDAFIIRVSLHDILKKEIKNPYIQNSDVAFSIDKIDIELSDQEYSIKAVGKEFNLLNYSVKVESIKNGDLHIRDILNNVF